VREVVCREIEILRHRPSTNFTGKPTNQELAVFCSLLDITDCESFLQKCLLTAADPERIT
jgi:hypothetical protein